MSTSSKARTRRPVVAPSVRPECCRAFTLFEALLALFLMIALLSGVYAFYATALRARREGGQIAQEAMRARWLLERMAEEIRHTTDIVPGDGIGFRGDEHSITIVRTRMPELYAFQKFDLVLDDLPPAQLDLVRISYNLLWDDELEDEEGVPICHGLWRTEQKTFDPNPKFVVADAEAPEEDVGEDEEGEEEEFLAPQSHGELIAPEIKYIEFEYFDGAEWQEKWQSTGEGAGAGPGGLGAGAAGQGGYVLPQAVKITIGKVLVPPEEQFELDEEELEEEEEDEEELEEHHPDRFTIIVDLLQADQSLISSRKYGVATGLGREEGVP